MERKGKDSLAGTIVKTRHAMTGISPCVRITSVKQGAVMAKMAISDMLAQSKKNSKKKQKKGSAKGQVALRKEYIQLGCVSQDSQPRKSILRKAGKL